MPNFEFEVVEKCENISELVNSFAKRIFSCPLAKSASMQPKTNAPKFATMIIILHTIKF